MDFISRLTGKEFQHFKAEFREIFTKSKYWEDEKLFDFQKQKFALGEAILWDLTRNINHFIK